MRSFHSVSIAIAVAFTAAGCGGGAAQEGRVDGRDFSASGAAASTIVADSTQSGLAAIFLDTGGQICPLAQSDKSPKNVDLLSLDLFETDANGLTFEPRHTGDYAVLTGAQGPNGTYVRAVWTEVDGSCTAKQTAVAASGKVTLTGFAGGHYTGSYDLTFSDGHLSGAFDALDCPGILTNNTTCQ